MQSKFTQYQSHFGLYLGKNAQGTQGCCWTIHFEKLRPRGFLKGKKKFKIKMEVHLPI